MISALTESLCMITAHCCSRTKKACSLLFWIWRIFHGNILCLSWVTAFCAVIDNFSTKSQATPPACHFNDLPVCVCAYCKIIIVQFITLAKKISWIYKTERSSSWHQTVHRPTETDGVNKISSSFSVIRGSAWGCPDRLCCPCTDKWLPLLKGPTPHLDKQRNQQNTLKHIPSLMIAEALKWGALVCTQVSLDVVHTHMNLWRVEA